MALWALSVESARPSALHRRPSLSPLSLVVSLPKWSGAQGDAGEDGRKEGAEGGQGDVDANLDVELAGEHGNFVKTPDATEAEDRAAENRPHGRREEGLCNASGAHELGRGKGADEGDGNGRGDEFVVPLWMNHPEVRITAVDSTEYG